MTGGAKTIETVLTPSYGTVELISTSRDDLKVCSADDQIVDLIKGNIEKYDYGAYRWQRTAL
jgi:hypothetical protein